MVKLWEFPKRVEALETEGEETMLCDVAKLHEWQGREEALEARICALEKDIQMVEQQQSPSLIVVNDSEEGEKNYHFYTPSPSPALQRLGIKLRERLGQKTVAQIGYSGGGGAPEMVATGAHSGGSGLATREMQ